MHTPHTLTLKHKWKTDTKGQKTNKFDYIKSVDTMDEGNRRPMGKYICNKFNNELIIDICKILPEKENILS